jgi:hypothetical protein
VVPLLAVDRVEPVVCGEILNISYASVISSLVSFLVNSVVLKPNW